MRALPICLSLAAVPVLSASVEEIVYSAPGAEPLKMVYTAPPKARRPSPVAVLLRAAGSNPAAPVSLAGFKTNLLTAAGYAVFAVNYRTAPKYPFPAMIDDAQRAVRFIRHNARRWNADPRRIAVAGGAEGGLVSNFVGLLEGLPIRSSRDPVDRASATVQAVVSLFSPSDYRGRPPSPYLRALLGPLLAQKGEETALAAVSPVMHIRTDAPPFLLVHGDRDTTVPLVQSTHLQNALHAAGVRCDLIIISNGTHGIGRWRSIPGVRDWESEMVEWLNEMLHHGPVHGSARPSR